MGKKHLLVMALKEPYRIPEYLWLRLKNFFYEHTSVENFFWKKRITSLWQEVCDRRYMKFTVFPAVGNYLKDSKTKKVLDIGAEWYDINNRDYFGNSDIDYWVIDVNEKPKYLKSDHFLRVSILDLPNIYNNLESYFDIVISYGVLGFLKFDKKSVNKYLENVHKILMPNGIFLLKLDTSTMEKFEEEFRINLDVIHKYFSPFSIAGLPEEKLVGNGKIYYTFYTLRKRLMNDGEKGVVN